MHLVDLPRVDPWFELPVDLRGSLGFEANATVVIGVYGGLVGLSII